MSPILIKIAFLVLNQKDQIRRCEAFIKNSPEFEYTIVFLKEEWEIRIGKKFELSYEIPIGNVKYIHVEDFRNEDFQLVLPNTDKTIDFLISQRYHGMINANDKRVFQEKINEFGKFDFLRTNLTDQFLDNDIVMMKPRISSGGYSSNPLCYNRRTFSEVMQFSNDREFLIQEFVPSFDILLLSFVSNGRDFVLYDIVEQEFRPAAAGNIFTSFMQSDLSLKESPKVKELIRKTREFVEFIDYKQFIGFFGVQFLVKDGKYFPIDCNLRTGPVAMEIEFRNIADTRMYKSIPFFFGDQNCKEYLENPKGYQQYRCYAELAGKPVTEKKFTPNYEGRVSILSEKTSGTFRSDFTMYIERTS